MEAESMACKFPACALLLQVRHSLDDSVSFKPDPMVVPLERAAAQVYADVIRRCVQADNLPPCVPSCHHVLPSVVGRDEVCSGRRCLVLLFPEQRDSCDHVRVLLLREHWTQAIIRQASDHSFTNDSIPSFLVPGKHDSDSELLQAASFRRAVGSAVLGVFCPFHQLFRQDLHYGREKETKDDVVSLRPKSHEDGAIVALNIAFAHFHGECRYVTDASFKFRCKWILHQHVHCRYCHHHLDCSATCRTARKLPCSSRNTSSV